MPKSAIEKALDYATTIIRSYEADIRNSEWVGVDLVQKGFCQGFIYKDALNDIARIASGEIP